MSESQNSSPNQTPALRTSQLIHSALTIGLIVLTILLTVVHFTLHQGKPMIANLPNVGGSSLFFIIAVLLTGVGIASGVTMPKGLLNVAVKEQAKTPADPQSDETKLLGAFVQSTIMRSGLLEGPGITSLIFFLVSGDYLLLALVGVLVALMLVFFPTQSMLNRWLSEGHEALERERQNV